MKTKLAIFFSVTVIIISSCEKLDISRINKIATDNIEISNSAITAKGTIVDISKNGISKYGHCWSAKNNTPTVSDLKTELGTANETGEFISELKNLSANTEYFFRAYASDGENVIYGDTKSFNTSSVFGIAVSTTQPAIINESSVTIDGAISGVGSVNIIDYGHCWGATASPTINDLHTSKGLLQTDINFSSSITSLPIEENYYVRAYAKLDNSTVIYSSDATVFIPDLKLITGTVTVPTGNNAIFQGTISSLGIYPITDYGHCWSELTSNPNINNNKISLGTTSSTGNFYTNLTLTSGTTYYYRAYAIANNTVKYGVVKKISY